MANYQKGCYCSSDIVDFICESPTKSDALQQETNQKASFNETTVLKSLCSSAVEAIAPLTPFTKLFLLFTTLFLIYCLLSKLNEECFRFFSDDDESTVYGGSNKPCQFIVDGRAKAKCFAKLTFQQNLNKLGVFLKYDFLLDNVNNNSTSRVKSLLSLILVSAASSVLGIDAANEIHSGIVLNKAELLLPGHLSRGASKHEYKDRLLTRFSYLDVDFNKYWRSPKDLYKKRSPIHFKFFPNPEYKL